MSGAQVLRRHHPREVRRPDRTRVAAWYTDADLVDAFAIALPPDATTDSLRLAEFVFSAQPWWVAALMAVRDAAVRPFGLKTSRQLKAPQATSEAKRVGLFRVYTSTHDEVVLGENDRHLDFRVSVLREPGRRPTGRTGDDARLVVTTVVRCHNRLGRAYIGTIRFFHRRVVIASLRHAAGRGWPTR